MIRSMSRFIAGGLAPFNGLLIIANHRALRRLAILPFVISLLVFTFGLTLGLPFITSRVAPFTRAVLSFLDFKATSKWAEILSWTLPILIWPALALALVFILMNLTRLIAAPLFGLLAVKILARDRLNELKKRSLWQRVMASIRQTKGAVVKTSLFLVTGLVLGLLSFLPGVGLFTGFLFLILLAYDVIDYSLDALEWPLDRRFAFFKAHFAVFLGLGVSLGLVFLVPGLNFFVLPASVVGASDLVRRMTRE